MGLGFAVSQIGWVALLGSLLQVADREHATDRLARFWDLHVTLPLTGSIAGRMESFSTSFGERLIRDCGAEPLGTAIRQSVLLASASLKRENTKSEDLPTVN